MGAKLRWGILGAATIATEQVIPAMIESNHGEIRAIASRSIEKAKQVASHFQIEKYYTSYQKLLDDAKIEAVYIPLPNHLHLEWAIRALRSGKHVLVEKPVALNGMEAQRLLELAKEHPKLKIMEAFMYKFHPQWIKAKQLVDEGRIGDLKIIQSSFSFYDDDTNSIVNHKEFGGGSLMDVGCYPVSISRYLFDDEPKKVTSSLVYDEELDVDIHATGTLEFAQGQTTFFSSIRLFGDQQAKLFGTKGSIEFELPFNPPVDRPSRIWLTDQNEKQEIVFEPCNQYTLQIETFSKAVLQDKELPVPFEDALKNMKVIDAIKKSGRIGRAVTL